MVEPFHTHTNLENRFPESTVLLDKKQGDINGDGILDHVFLVGNKPDGPTGIFADHITLVIQDGYSHKSSAFTFPNNDGYNAKLFLADFDKDQVADIWIGIDSGGSGGYGTFYIYSYKNNKLRQLFDFEKYNQDYSFHVNYEDRYRVSVSSPQLDILFTIDISNKGYSYLSTYYYDNGKLKKPVTGEVLALAALYPVVTNENRLSYDLLAYQRIIGTSNADTLGYVENTLTWDGASFVSSRLSVSILGTKLITHF